MILLIWGMTVWKDLGIDDWHDSWNCNQSCGFQGVLGIRRKGWGRSLHQNHWRSLLTLHLPQEFWCSHCLENHWQFLRDDKLFTHIPHWFAISEYMKYVKQDLLFFRALCYHWWCFMYFYLASKKITSLSGLLPARHYHTNQRWRLPSSPGQTASFPRPLWCCSWYWAFSQQWRQLTNWGFWKVLPWIQWWNTPVLSYKYHTPNPQFLHRQRFGWGPSVRKCEETAVRPGAEQTSSSVSQPLPGFALERHFPNLDSHIQVFSPLSLFEGQWTESQSLLWNSWYLGILLGISPFLNVFLIF